MAYQIQGWPDGEETITVGVNKNGNAACYISLDSINGDVLMYTAGGILSVNTGDIFRLFISSTGNTHFTQKHMIDNYMR